MQWNSTESMNQAPTHHHKTRNASQLQKEQAPFTPSHTQDPNSSSISPLLESNSLISPKLYQAAAMNRPSTCITLKDTKGVQFMGFSARGSYILTWERPLKAAADGQAGSNPLPNLKIWSSVTGKFLHGFYMKGCRKSQWPPIKWSHDEKLAFHLVSNEIHVYGGHSFLEEEAGLVRYVDKIRCKDVTSFSVPENFTPSVIQNVGEDTYLLSTFVEESKGKPARISLLRYPDRCGEGENPKSGPLLVSKSFYQAEECSVMWSPKGDAALILTTTTVDTSGNSYYGSTNLYLILSQSKTGLDGDALSVPLPGSGSVSDVAWIPNASKPSAFCVISGKMPAMASLHNGTTAEPIFLFGNGHRNTISWSDHGRFLTLGGFGNLAGGMDFYDRNKLKKIPQYDPRTGADLGANGNTASCTVGYGWSPSSRYFLVSTTTPRMNVDNGVKLYKYNGLEIRDKAIVSWDNAKFAPDRLLAAEFVPARPGAYPDRPQSPPPKRIDGEAANEKDVSGSDVVVATPPVVAAYVPPVGRYVPPGARNGGNGMSLAERMRKEREGNMMGATKVIPKNMVASGDGKKLPVGMTPANDGKSKSAMRKERQKLAKLKAEQAEREEKERKEREEKERMEAAANDPVKKAKKLNKILKQIVELKARDPSTLNDDQ
eukprot:CAMPEP_0176496930 /NCGR_PEP_ID=MMETSP0200_2-20121128/11451_1 /TAXON_ID=947934 /ORGANISM="Chaetoceros sp., Strain GSL56" /LENGTH=657 /DNA_ID=CAMNT_0017894905 /DNA_START=33 /DNA_END=2003 /DNA_ORIENTATION=+